MAENAHTEYEELVRDMITLLWGSTIKEDVFSRWAQGFYFSDTEPTALVQREGGPCAVIAPVQAFIIKQLLTEGDVSTWKDVHPDKCDELLVKAMCDIIKQAADSQKPEYFILHIDETCSMATESVSDAKNVGTENKEESGSSEPSTAIREKKVVDSNEFHAQLRLFITDHIEMVEKFFKTNIHMMKDHYGILLLLYTVVCTKGVSQITAEMSDTSEPMIDSTYGYGSQSLINLMLTGRAVNHVWDHDQNVGGLTLKGIDKQNTIGFLALLEHLRYCEVGTFLKNPSHPVWVLGSETHLTVLFSNEKLLVSPETPAEKAKRIFKKFDPEGNNFIASNLLQDVLAELGLVAEVEYVNIMRRRLDNECLGIILLASFMEEFFPDDHSTCPDTFTLYHYNGLPRSNPNDVIKYHKGQAVQLECTVKCILDSNPMLTVLQTKWPRIEIQWENGQNPSLN